MRDEHRARPSLFIYKVYCFIAPFGKSIVEVADICGLDVVHHSGMIGADELAFEALAGLAIYHVTIDLTVAIDHATFT